MEEKCNMAHSKKKGVDSRKNKGQVGRNGLGKRVLRKMKKKKEKSRS